MPDCPTREPTRTPTEQRGPSRRGFLQAAGTVAGTTLWLAGCDGTALPGNRQPTAGLSVSGLDDNVVDDLTVTFTVEYADPDAGEQAAGDDRIVEAYIRLSDGVVIDLLAEGVESGGSIEYTFDRRGEKTATLIVVDAYNGRQRVEETFVVGVEPVSLDFSNDIGVLNYVYALEQLGAAFYARVVSEAFGTAITDETERQYFEALAAHEAIHRDFLKAAIEALGGPLLPTLLPNFSRVDFSRRDQVIGTAQVLEETGVSACNGAARFFTGSDRDLLVRLVAKLVSVEARHAAAVRALHTPSRSTYFADLAEHLHSYGAVPGRGLGVALPPDEVLALVNPLVVTPIELQNFSG